MCQLFFGTGEQSAMGEIQLRGDVRVGGILLGSGIHCLALHLLTPLAGFGQGLTLECAFIPTTALACNSKEPARHSSSDHRWPVCISPVVEHCMLCLHSSVPVRVPIGLVLVQVCHRPHLLVAHVRFVTAGTSHGFSTKRAAVLHAVEAETPSPDTDAWHC